MNGLYKQKSMQHFFFMNTKSIFGSDSYGCRMNVTYLCIAIISDLSFNEEEKKKWVQRKKEMKAHKRIAIYEVFLGNLCKSFVGLHIQCVELNTNCREKIYIYWNMLKYHDYECLFAQMQQ